jgi:hypothetical protein
MVVAKGKVIERVEVEGRGGTQPLEVALDEATRRVAEASMDTALLVDAAAIVARALPERIARKATSLPVRRLSPLCSRRLGVQVPV